MNSWVIRFAAMMLLGGSVLAAEPEFQDIFVSGDNGYELIRVPQILVTERGTLLVFAQGRDGRHDQSGNDIILKRSEDDGRSWSDLRVIAEEGDDSLNSICVLQLRESGRILVVGCVIPQGYNLWAYEYASEAKRGRMRRHGRSEWPALPDGYGEGSARTYVIHSDDDGKSWSLPRDITRQTKRADALTCIPGPGLGIELRHGPHAGRIVIPCYEFRLLEDPKPHHETLPYAIYSDDGGETWEMGDLARPGEDHRDLGANESQVAELDDGRLYLSARISGHTAARVVAHSADGGRTWSPLTPEPQIPGPACAAGLTRYDEDRLLFSLPRRGDRTRGIVRMSRDEARSWPVTRELRRGRFAYSCLARLPDGEVACVFGGRTTPAGEGERGPKCVVLARFPLEWLEQ